MNPRTAALICGVLVAFVLIYDVRHTASVSKATWVPLVWVLVLASRPVAQWFDPSAGAFAADPTEGTAMDRNLLIFLMAAAYIVLARRRIEWGRWVLRNRWVFIYLVFAAISVLWSDYPAIALKRWFRAVGAILVILIILSEEDPVAAFAAIVRRCAWILVPASIVLFKYYRDVAVVYNTWTGQEYVIGVSTDKNGLGRLCLVAGIFAFWELFVYRDWLRKTSHRLLHMGLHVSLLGLAWWMLVASHSSTALGCMLFGCLLFLVFGLINVERRTFLGTIILAVIGMGALLALGTDMMETVVASLGRDMTLTDRVFVWRDLLDMGTDPLIGVGYDSFWLGQRLEHFIDVHQVNEAHSGYISIYIELGAVGLALFVALVLSAYSKAKSSLALHPAYAKLRLALIAICLVYNVTEAADKATTLIFFMLLAVAMDPPKARLEGEGERQISHGAHGETSKLRAVASRTGS